MRLFIFGAGYSARAVVLRLKPRLQAVAGTSREPNRAAAGSRGSTPILFDGESRSEAVAEALTNADHVLVSIPPSATGDPVLNHHRANLAALKPQSLVYLSTIGVYGDHAGSWVDEASECRPRSTRSRLRLAAESGWRLFAEETGVPVAILRLGGIYGPGRGPFEKIRRGGARRIIKPGQIFNRIHVDDIAAIAEAAFDHRANGIYNGVDDEPAPPEDVIGYAARLLGVPPPAAVDFVAAELTPMARSFYDENKRVHNAKVKRELGVRLAYPTYREGLAAILASEEAARSKASAISS